MLADKPSSLLGYGFPGVGVLGLDFALRAAKGPSASLVSGVVGVVTTTNGDQPLGAELRGFCDSSGVARVSIESGSAVAFFPLNLMLASVGFWPSVGEGGDGERVRGYEMGGYLDWGDEEEEADEEVVNLLKKE